MHIHVGFFGHCMWDLSSLTRDQTHAPAVEAQSPNCWTTRCPLMCALNAM